MPYPVMLATEDELSENVCVRLIEEHSERIEPSPHRFRKGGFGYLKSRMSSFLDLSQHKPLLLLTDLDKCSCPPALIGEWLSGRLMPAKLLFRVAVREVESWLLADEVGMRQLFGPRFSLPQAPDDLPDPKSALVNNATKAPRLVRQDIVPDRGSTAKQGIGYNNRLCEFVRTTWSPQRAAQRSPSLSRTIVRLGELADSLQVGQ